MRPPSTAAYSMLKRRITTLLGVAALTATVVVVPAAAATTATGAGTRPDGFEAPQTLTAAAASESSMEMLVNERGRISKSVDATAGRLLEVDKPDGATVRGAYLGVATTGFKQFRLPAGSVTLAGQPVTLGNETASGI